MKGMTTEYRSGNQPFRPRCEGRCLFYTPMSTGVFKLSAVTHLWSHSYVVHPLRCGPSGVHNKFKLSGFCYVGDMKELCAVPSLIPFELQLLKEYCKDICIL